MRNKFYAKIQLFAKFELKNIIFNCKDYLCSNFHETHQSYLFIVNPITVKEYKAVVAYCKELFLKKTADYGTSWRIMRLESITDQIYIKARRIRSIQEKGTQKVAENIEEEFVAIINYAIMALMQIELQSNDNLQLSVQEVADLYDRQVDAAFKLLSNKNHDYDEAWRQMRVSSMTDIILMKLLRIKQIEDNEGKTLVSEGVAANYQDMINYAIFCLIQMGFVKI